MVVGVPGLTMAPAAKTVGEVQRQEQDLAQFHHLHAVAQPVLEALLRPPVATTSVVLSMGVGVLGLTMEPAAKHVEEAARPEPDLALVRHLPVGGQTVLEALLRPPFATTSVVLSMVVGAPGLTLGHAVKRVEGAPRLRPDLATTQVLHVGGNLAQEANLKTPPATHRVVQVILMDRHYINGVYRDAMCTPTKDAVCIQSVERESSDHVYG